MVETPGAEAEDWRDEIRDFDDVGTHPDVAGNCWIGRRSGVPGC
jgi:hypothetical protein